MSEDTEVAFKDVSPDVAKEIKGDAQEWQRLEQMKRYRLSRHAAATVKKPRFCRMARRAACRGVGRHRDSRAKYMACNH